LFSFLFYLTASLLVHKEFLWSFIRNIYYAHGQQMTDLGVLPQESPRSPGAVGTQQPRAQWAADGA
jgi:hypothetical protein